MRRSPAAALWYALAILVVVGGPAAVVFLLGTPELALPSEWADARARIDDGTLPAGAVVDIVSVVLVLAWGAGLWFLLAGVLKQDDSTQDESARDESTRDETDFPITNDGSEPDEPWYRQGPPIFDEPFSDEYPRVVVPPDEMTPDDGPQDSVWQPATMTADAGDPLGMLSPDATAEDMVSDAEIIGDASGSNPDEHPMIVPVRAYYFTRAEDTLRSISAQFLHTPKRWQELRSLNAASPGVAAVGPDTLLPTGTALALPGDPVPWGNPDPVYLWTLAEKFLFTAWGREPTPEEVVPFWRGLTSGTQLEAGAPPARPEYLTAPAPTEPPAPEIAREPAPTPTEPPAPSGFWSPPPPVPGMEPSPAPADFQPPPPITPPAYESPAPPTHEPPPPAYEPPVPPTHEPAPPAYEPAAADLQPPAAYEPPPAPPTHEPPPPAYEPPVPPSHEPAPAPAAFQPPPPATPPAYESPVPPTHEPPPPAYESPVPPSHEPAPAPAAFRPPPPATPPAYESPVPPSHEPPPPAYEPAPPAYEPRPPAYEPPPPPYQSPVPPSHEPRPPAYEPAPPAYEPPPAPPTPGLPDFGPIEPEVPYVEAEAPRMPSFMPSLTGAETAAPARRRRWWRPRTGAWPAPP